MFEPLLLLGEVYSMIFVFWNCRGADNLDFKITMKDLYRDYKPNVITLLETKIHFKSMGNYFNQFGLTENIHINPQGRVGGIWILWNLKAINLKSYHVSQKCIHVIVTRNRQYE